VAGIIGAILVTWVTFVPCFMLVFLGAPHIESLRGNKRLSAALTGVTASVVGVIANLAVFFFLHTVFSRVRSRSFGPIEMVVPEWSSFSPRALLVAVLAAVLVFKLKMSTLKVLGICAFVGAAMYLAVN
jgi:chromate transporter